MARFCWPRFLAAGVVAALSGCSGFEVRERPAWRTQAEEACLAQNLVQASAWIQPSDEIDGPGICGLHHPFKVRGLADGTVTVTSTATLDCSMIPALAGWIKDVLQPAAQARFGERIAEVRTMGAYNCRGINNETGANLSEHSFGNAIDIGSFVLQSGRVLNVLRGWQGGDEQERAFLREAHGGACGFFTTVLGPGANAYHANHFHLDLAMHGNSSRGLRRVCRPTPAPSLPPPPARDALPDAPAVEEEIDMARAEQPGVPAGTASGEPAALALASPAPNSTPFRSPRRPRPPLDLGPHEDAAAPAVSDEDAQSPALPSSSAPAEWDLTSSIRARR